jgi:hypothetical protein
VAGRVRELIQQPASFRIPLEVLACLPLSNSLSTPLRQSCPTLSPLLPRVVCILRCHTALSMLDLADQLDSASMLAKHMPVTSQPWCRFGCPVFETTHHIFTTCPRFSCLPENATQKLTSGVSTILHTFRTSPDDHPQMMSVVSNLFHDGNVLPTGHSLYYYGIIPVLCLEDIRRTAHSPKGEVRHTARRSTHSHKMCRT